MTSHAGEHLANWIANHDCVCCSWLNNFLRAGNLVDLPFHVCSDMIVLVNVFPGQI
jgi:hypothetical protein